MDVEEKGNIFTERQSMVTMADNDKRNDNKLNTFR